MNANIAECKKMIDALTTEQKIEYANYALANGMRFANLYQFCLARKEYFAGKV